MSTGAQTCGPFVQQNLVCEAVDVARDTAHLTRDTALDGIADSFVASFGQMVTTSTTFWLGSGTAQNGQAAAGAIDALRADTAWFVGALAVVSLLVAAGRMALTRSGRSAADAGRSLVLLVLVTAVGTPAVLALWRAGDLFAVWVVSRSSGPELDERLAALAAALGDGDAALGGAGVILVAGFGIVSSLGMIALLTVRVAVLVVLAGLLPVLAAAAGTRTGRQSFARACSWVLAFVLFKPVSALVYAGGFRLIGQGEDTAAVLSGVSLIVLAVFTLPALVKLVAPVVTAASGDGGGGGMGTAGVVVATGARALAGRAR